MSFTLLVAALAWLAAGALAACCAPSDRWARRIGAFSAVPASGLGAAASLLLLADGSVRAVRVAWSPPIQSLSVGVDPLSSFFLLCIFAVGGLSALYATGYLASRDGEGRLGLAVACLNVLIAAMACVVLARDVVVFLVAWEAMFAASYFLVVFDGHDAAVQRAGFTYLVASHASVVLLFVFFGLLARQNGSLEFAAFAGSTPSAGSAAAIFLFALAGFGIKAGLWPLHGWLPEAHPAAPSHVSALMSGAMVKIGVYGLLRALTFLGPPAAWWGIAVLVLGSLSAVAGVLLALGQDDLKRLLAYSTVENVGIIALGIGVGLLGEAGGAPAVALAGFGGALLHTLNHGLFKSLLFQAAGAIAHATGTRSIDAQGGLMRRMPFTGACFLLGAVAIAGLPPLNGFAGELLIYLGALRQAASGSSTNAADVAIAAIPVLGLAGGLAAVAFAKAFGIAFLGAPRGSGASHGAHDVTGTMRAAMALGAAACLAIGVFPARVAGLLGGPLSVLTGNADPTAGLAIASLQRVSLIAVAMSAALGLAVVRRRVFPNRAVAAAETWGCGYAAPSARMQYTGASFVEPALAPFVGLLRTRIDRVPVEGFFPRYARETVSFQDPGESMVNGAAHAVSTLLGGARFLQRGPVQLYLLYILLTLLAFLAWQMIA